MQTNHPLEANILPQSAATLPPISADHADSESNQTLDLNLGLSSYECDQKSSEITTRFANTLDVDPHDSLQDSISRNGMPQLDSSKSQPKRTDLAGSTLQWLDPRQIQIGNMPNRTPDAYQDESFDALCVSMAANGGNTQPIQVHTLATNEGSEPGENYMLISGERRLRAAIENGQHVLALVIHGAISADIEVLVLTENLSREDLSPFEWGRQLIHVMQVKPAYNVSRLAKISGRHKSVISRAIELASLPVEIVQAFTSVRDLRYADAKPLLAAYQKSRENVIVEAELIKAEAEDLKGPAVVKRLVAAAEGTVAPCNTSEPIPIRFEDREVGALSATKGGGSQLLITIEISEQQRKALALHVEQFVSSRVLRASDASAEKVGLKKRSKANSVKFASNLTQTITTQNGA